MGFFLVSIFTIAFLIFSIRRVNSKAKDIDPIPEPPVVKIEAKYYGKYLIKDSSLKTPWGYRFSILDTSDQDVEGKRAARDAKVGDIVFFYPTSVDSIDVTTSRFKIIGTISQIVDNILMVNLEKIVYAEILWKSDDRTPYIDVAIYFSEEIPALKKDLIIKQKPEIKENMNLEETKRIKGLNFVAVDFETMTADLRTACSIGMVKVIDGVITSEFYSLIKPVEDNQHNTNTWLHGISSEMCADKPTFAELVPDIKNFIAGLPLVCHNASTDINIIDRCLEHYNLEGEISTFYYRDTYSMTKLSLASACEAFGIELNEHHNSLDDAKACAKVCIYCYENKFIPGSIENKSSKKREHPGSSFPKGRKEKSGENLKQKNLDEVENKDTIFFDKKVVYTGEFEAFTRDTLILFLKDLGANVNTTISRKTDIVIVGHNPGPAKMKKTEELSQAGVNICMLNEEDVLKVMEDTNFKI